MYKITLFDNNLPSFFSGTISIYCDDIDEFEKEWVLLNNCPEEIEKFRRSKAGEIVTDYYSDDESLNIVQQDHQANTFFEKRIELSKRKVVVHNGFDFPMYVYFDKAYLWVRYVYFQGEYLRLVKYKLFGCYIESPILPGSYRAVPCWGNKILKRTIHSNSEEMKNNFKNDTVESIAYYPLKILDSYEEMKQDYAELEHSFPSEEEIDILLSDIPGDAG